MFRWLRRTLFGYNAQEKKVKKLKHGSTFKYKGKGYRVRGERAYEIDGSDNDFLEMFFLLDVISDGVLDFDFGWSPHQFPDETAHIQPEVMESVIAQMAEKPDVIPFDSVQEEPQAEVSSRDEFQLEQEIERPSIAPYVPEPEPEPVKSYSPPPEPAYVPDPEPARSYDTGGSSSYDSGGSSSYDSGGSSDCGGCSCD